MVVVVGGAVVVVVVVGGASVTTGKVSIVDNGGEVVGGTVVVGSVIGGALSVVPSPEHAAAMSASPKMAAVVRRRITSQSVDAGDRVVVALQPCGNSPAPSCADPESRGCGFS